MLQPAHSPAEYELLEAIRNKRTETDVGMLCSVEPGGAISGFNFVEKNVYLKVHVLSHLRHLSVRKLVNHTAIKEAGRVVRQWNKKLYSRNERTQISITKLLVSSGFLDFRLEGDLDLELDLDPEFFCGKS